ncbi:MAG: tyrosine-type recombinase/integrase, partial [Bacteroidales bacterium]
GLDVLRVIRWIGLEPSVEVPGRKKKATVYGFHSLRHSFASHCAEAGVPKAVLLSILGTDSDIADKYYTHIGDEAQEKAIAAIANITTTKSAQQRINEALELINSTSEPSDIVLEKVKSILTK